MNRLTHLVCALLLVTGPVGCVREISGAPEAGVRVDRLRTFHVIEGDSKEVAAAVRDELAGRGFSVTTGEASATPPAADCKVSVADKWWWDITMYPLEIKIELIDPKSGALLASGRSYRTSLVRSSPRAMATEILDKIFANVRRGGGTTAMDAHSVR